MSRIFICFFKSFNLFVKVFILFIDFVSELIKLSVFSCISFSFFLLFFYFLNLFFKDILLIMLLQLSHFCPFTPLLSAHPLLPTFPSSFFRTAILNSLVIYITHFHVFKFLFWRFFTVFDGFLLFLGICV